MNKLGFPGLKGLDHLRSFAGTAKGVSTPRASESLSYGNFASLKLTAEKLVKEQASVKTDLDMAHTKLKKTMEQIHVLEAKLQEAVNENAKLKVKQTEDAKLWKGLDSKLSSTKTLYDQLTETLQHLVCQARAAEEEKKIFEEKLVENSKAFDNSSTKLNDLTKQLETADNTIRIGNREMLELRHEKEELEKTFRDEHSANENAIKGKDTVIKQLEDAAEENSAHLQTLDSQLQRMQQELMLKEEVCKCLRVTQENLENEKATLQFSIQDFTRKLDVSCQRAKELEDLVHLLTDKIIELDKESTIISDQLVNLFSSFKTHHELAQQEKDLVISSAQEKYDQLQKQSLHITSEKDALSSEVSELKKKIIELQKAQEINMVQHVEECRLAEDKIRGLEHESVALVSKKNESEKLIAELGLEVKHLTESASQTDIQMQELLQKFSRLESENNDLQDKVQTVLQEKAEERETLQNEIDKGSTRHCDSLENQISELRSVLEEKEQLHLSSVEREKQLEAQRSEIQELIAASESKLFEAKKQYDMMLEGKKIELSKHLKELSQRSDQAINEIRKKYESEKVEIVNVEKEKADKLVKEMEKKCDEKLSENKEAARQYLMRVKGEHGAMIIRIQQEHDQKESSLQTQHKDELKRIQLHAETEMREKVSSLRKEHETQIKSLTMEHEDACRRMMEELELQKSKEDKQRALLQMQWKVMSQNQQHDQEVNSKKEIQKRGLKVAVASIPKIIDDDIAAVDKSVGFDTIVEEAIRATNAAHVEVESVEKGNGAVSVAYGSKFLAGCPERAKEFLRSTDPTICLGLEEHLLDAPLIFKKSMRNGSKDAFKSLGCVIKRHQLKCFPWYLLLFFLLLGSFQPGAYAKSDESGKDFEIDNSARVESDGSIMMTSEAPRSKGCIYYKHRFPSIHPLRERRSSFGFTCSFYKSDYSLPSLNGLSLTVVLTSERKLKNRSSAKTILVTFTNEHVLLQIGNGGISSANIRRVQQTMMAQKISVYFDSGSSKLQVWLDHVLEAIVGKKVDLFEIFGDDPIGVGLCSETQVGAALVIIKWRFEMSNGAVPSPTKVLPTPSSSENTPSPTSITTSTASPG